MSEGFLAPHGGWRDLLSYQKALIIFSATEFFCKHYIDRKSRTYDQMIQAARSGKQNIVEGNEAGATSRDTEITLTNVARSSLQELLEDYKDFLRDRKAPIWEKDDRRAQVIRKLAYEKDVNYGTYAKYVEGSSPDIAANTIICLINQACYLLDKQLRAQEERFLREGGIREKMTRARLQARRRQEEGEWER